MIRLVIFFRFAESFIPHNYNTLRINLPSVGFTPPLLSHRMIEHRATPNLQLGLKNPKQVCLELILLVIGICFKLRIPNLKFKISWSPYSSGYSLTELLCRLWPRRLAVGLTRSVSRL